MRYIQVVQATVLPTSCFIDFCCRLDIVKYLRICCSGIVKDEDSSSDIVMQLPVKEAEACAAPLLLAGAAGPALPAALHTKPDAAHFSGPVAEAEYYRCVVFFF